DLGWLRDRGLAAEIVRRAKAGCAVVAICGGYQMLGRIVRDHTAAESLAGEMPGLGLLDVTTMFLAGKQRHQATATVRGGAAWLAGLAGETVVGYEIHLGSTPSRDP